jgi:hypothetical protein
VSVIISYDVDSSWDEVRRQALKLGFVNVVPTTSGTHVLPSGTLFIEGLSTAAALQRFDVAIEDARTASGTKIAVEKLVAGELTDWRIRSNRRS